MATLNRRRMDTIRDECKARSSFKASQWQQVNELISKMQEEIDPQNPRKCDKARPCILCRILQ
jgi:hypothetical protein